MTDSTGASAPAEGTATNVEATPNPGKGLGIAGLVLGLFLGLNLVGLVLSIVGLRKSRKAGQQNGFALAGIIVSSVSIAAAIVIGLAVYPGLSIAAACAEVPPGQYTTQDGNVVTCP